jgi:hypothetical protein
MGKKLRRAGVRGYVSIIAVAINFAPGVETAAFWPYFMVP